MMRLAVLVLICNFIYSSEKVNNSIKKNGNTVNSSVSVDKVVEKSKGDISVGNKLSNNVNSGDIAFKSIKFNKKPFFLGIGFDPFTLIYNLTTNFNNFMDAKTNNLLDFRFKVDLGFNRLIYAINFGVLWWKLENTLSDINYTKTTNAFFINPCVYYNFLKKNSSRNALYVGGGINFNGTFYTEVDNNNDENSADNTFSDKKFWLWFNLELGNRIKIVKFLHINANFRITFLNFNLKKDNDKLKQEISSHHNLYGYGYYEKSYNVEFCLNFLFNIDLFYDKKVEVRESYLYL